MIAYLISCAITGRGYIGITSRSLKQRWAEHLYDASKRHAKMAISRAIAKYGPENFQIEALCSARTWADICISESLLIEQHGTRAPAGYNLSTGGEGAFGVKKSAESIERSAAKHRGKPCHPNTRAASSLFHRGRPKSAETRARMSAAKTGTIRSFETRAKIAAAKKGLSCNVGSANGGAKLTEAQVREARRRLASGESQRSIARSFDIHFNAIWKIANGIKWRHVT